MFAAFREEAFLWRCKSCDRIELEWYKSLTNGLSRQRQVWALKVLCVFVIFLFFSALSSIPLLLNRGVSSEGIMSHVNPTLSQKQRLLEANAFRCCVCKRSSIGFNFHHIES